MIITINYIVIYYYECIITIIVFVLLFINIKY